MITRVLAAAALLLAGCLDATTLDDVPCPDGGTALTYEGFGRGFLGDHCDRCHASDATARHGAPSSVTFDTIDDVHAHLDRIFARAAADNTTMPPGPDDPPAADRDRLAEWLACGAP